MYIAPVHVWGGGGGGEWEGVTLNDNFVSYGLIRQKLTLCSWNMEVCVYNSDM